MYALLGASVKEELAIRVRAELESILFSSELAAKINSAASSGESNSSKSSSTLSINNNNKNSEVVNVDDYIEKVTGGEKEKEEKEEEEEEEEGSTSYNSASTVSSLSRLSAQYFFCMEELNSYLDFREDFNAAYVNELQRTSWFKSWLEANGARLEKSLFSFDSQALVETTITDNQTTSNTQQLTNRFNSLYAKYTELEQTRLSHPFNGQMSVSDIKLKFNFLFTGTESGRKINKIVNNAVSQAKSTLGSFFSSWSSSSGGSSSAKNNSAQSVKSTKS